LIVTLVPGAQVVPLVGPIIDARCFVPIHFAWTKARRDPSAVGATPRIFPQPVFATGQQRPLAARRRREAVHGRPWKLAVPESLEAATGPASATKSRRAGNEAAAPALTGSSRVEDRITAE
jgi:hypothetical protein